MRTWADILDATNESILQWAGDQPWARAMANCEQDSEWHAEGDVWTHTRMVCHQLEQLAEWEALERERQVALLFGALLHDAGKPTTTIVEPGTGRIRSPNHSLVGARLARTMLRELACPMATREAVVNLVRFHSRPAHLLEKSAPEREIIHLSWLVNNRDLHLLALADTRGRLTGGQRKPEEQMQLWQMLAEEQHCYLRPYQFKNDQARFLFYRDRLSNLHYAPHEDYRCVVTLMSGLPGAGKDTWLSNNRRGLPVVALDAVREALEVDATDNQGRVIQSAREKVRDHLRNRSDFAFNATNLTRQMRRRWIDLFADYEARVEIVYLEPPLELLLKRNSKRERAVPESVVLRLLDRLEPPALVEAHGLLFG